MLRLARRNAPRAQFVAADARCFSLAISQCAVLSTFNSLAHFLTLEELGAVFANVRAVLGSSGRFLFDLTMEEGYRRRWRGSFQLSDEGDTCTIRPTYDPVSRMARNQVVVARHSAGASKREHARFTILQKCHTQQEIVSLLRDAGFSGVQSFDAERDLALPGDFGRRFFLAV
jgi:hypothetical protein